MINFMTAIIADLYELDIERGRHHVWSAALILASLGFER